MRTAPTPALPLVLAVAWSAFGAGGCSDASGAAPAPKLEVDFGSRLDAALPPTAQTQELPTPPNLPGAGDPAAGDAGAAASDVQAPPPTSFAEKPVVGGDGVRRIRFADLSLIGLDVDAIFDPDDDSMGVDDLPESIRALDGQSVALDGYMLPLEWEGKTVVSFMLVRDMASCCFGGMPMPDEWVEVTMQGKGTEYYPYIPVLVTGVLSIGGEVDDLGYVTGAYSLKATKVRDDP